jgi:hypothetical protein
MSRLTSLVLAQRSWTAQIAIGLLCVAARPCCGSPSIPGSAFTARGSRSRWRVGSGGRGWRRQRRYCSGLSIVVGDYLFVSPRFAFGPISASEILSIALFSAVATAIALIGIRLRHAMARDARARLALQREIELRDRAINEKGYEHRSSSQPSTMRSSGSMRSPALLGSDCRRARLLTTGATAPLCLSPGAAKGNIQIYHPGSETLELAVYEGFSEALREFFASVKRDDAAVCGEAFSSGVSASSSKSRPTDPLLPASVRSTCSSTRALRQCSPLPS